MRNRKFSVRSCAAFLFAAAFAGVAFAQQPTPTPTLVINQERDNIPLAARNNLYCAGYIQTAPVDTDFEIVGGDDEREQNVFAQGDYVYVETGTRQVRVGDKFSVVRPRGRFDSRFTEKKGDLGIYVQEVGMLEVVRTKGEVSVARVTNSCDNLLFGDLVVPMETRVSPIFRKRPYPDVFAWENGKQVGRIVLARDGRETVARDQIVYIDLGSEDNVKIGDYLSIFRPLGTGGIRNKKDDEETGARDYGFQSDTFRGGKFSNQAARKSGDRATGDAVTQEEAKSRRPKNLRMRKFVGEMVILNVKERTATALIVRNMQEIHTGDYVELQ